MIKESGKREDSEGRPKRKQKKKKLSKSQIVKEKSASYSNL